MTQINDWFMNFRDYKDKTVLIEGYFISINGHYFVGRNGPPALTAQAAMWILNLPLTATSPAMKTASHGSKCTASSAATVHLNDHLTAPFYHLEAVKVENGSAGDRNHHRLNKEKSIFTPAREDTLFHFHISFYVHVKRRLPDKTASFLISTGARSSASCNILFSPKSAHRREPAGRRHRNRGHKADPSAYPDHRCRSRTPSKAAISACVKYLIPTVQFFHSPRAEHRKRFHLRLCRRLTPQIHTARRHSSSMRHGSTPAPHRSTGCSCATYAPGTP